MTYERSDTELLVDTLQDALTDPDGNSVTEALFAIAETLSSALSRLGTHDAATNMGAIELLSKSVMEGCTEIASALLEISNAIREHD